MATPWDKYLTEVVGKVWPGSLPAGTEDHSAAAMKTLFAAGTDCLKITIEARRERGVAIVASYRMNAEDFYQGELDLFDFGRQHKEWRIPGANCLDPAHPEVFAHWLEIFTEVANDFDIDGIEFDFRRWTHMISDPLKNHPILTKMVRQTQKMLQETARRKRRDRLLLGVRVGPSLDDPVGMEYPGGQVKNDISCRALGLDVKTWIEEELVDYVCPSLFWPRLPGIPKTSELVALATNKNVGVYPTVFPLPAWAEDAKNPVTDSPQTRRRHRDEIVQAALRCYEDGADGISTFNWSTYFPPGTVKQSPAKYSENYGRSNAGYQKVLMALHPKLGSKEALRQEASSTRL
ncbi:MAG: hypothetical protein FJW26_08825 [Acidimicrobiia bacterium]|nr:hypothetical protein [Acidimicrobiia bacterium]